MVVVDSANQQHLAWLARSFGRPDYLPLSSEDLEMVAGAGESISKYPGTHLFKEGEPASSAFLISSGEVEIYRTSSGKRRVVARVGPGSVLGDIAMFGQGTYISSARAVGRVSAYQFHRDRLIPELSKHPAVCMRWLVAGLRQLEETQRRVIHLMRKTVLAQVADLIVEEGDRSGEVHLSQDSMATLLGVARQTVNESIARLKILGAIDTGYRLVTITDRVILREVADEIRV